MIKRLPIKILLMVLVASLLLWLILSGESSEDNVNEPSAAGSEAKVAKLASAIQPITDAEAASMTPGVISGSLKVRANSSPVNTLSNEGLSALTRRFDEANLAIDNGQLEVAINGFASLISEYPSVIEPYLNLASIYAEQQQLEKARSVLLEGFDANPKAGMLFDHLKSVHGALAANSYRQALDTKAPSTDIRLSLARASNIVTQLDQNKRIAALQKQLKESRSQFDSSQQEAQNIPQQTALEIETQLSRVKANNLADKSAFESEISRLKTQLAEASQALSLSQTAEREALARVVRAEQDASNKVAEISKQLETQKASLLAAQALSDEQAKALAQAELSQSVALREAQARIRAADLAAKEANRTEGTNGVSSSVQQARDQVAVSLVQSWARAWSAQDVQSYVKHYANDYSSSQSITRQQWLEQREVRLTNKEFINVTVSDFKVKDLGSHFSVTFSQYYQSNTVDDTVTKRLTFSKIGDDWSKSRIVNERLVSR